MEGPEASEHVPLREFFADEGGQIGQGLPFQQRPGGCSRPSVRALPMALAVFGLAVLLWPLAALWHPLAAAQRERGAAGSAGEALQLWANPKKAAGALDPVTEDAEELGSHQFADEKAAEAAQQECRDAQPGEHCFNAVQFAMRDGIQYQPTWYPGLLANSTFREFQVFLHKEGRSSCNMPCVEGSEKPKEVPSGHKGDTQAAGNHQKPEQLPSGHEGDTGEAGSHQEAGGHEPGHVVHGYLCLCFLLGGLSIGCIIQVVQERLLPWIPYTCLLFLMGVTLSCIHELRPTGHWSSWPTWYISVSMWTSADPHLVFYIFLPVLVFAEAMRLNIKLAKKLFLQVLLLAGPGVALGTGLTAAFSHYVLPYHWSWATCLVFGSILSATDPVAVVALFNTLGVSPRLTMLISGESLLNDGTAIVLFTLTLGLMLGKTVTPAGFAQFFLQMTGLSVLLGIALASAGLYLISKCTETKYHSDPMIQVCVTICLSMLCFFVAESEVETSGVLTVVVAGCVFSHYAWPLFASRETIHIVWEAIEFFGNTVIFLLAGLLFGHRCLTRTGHLQTSDIGWLGLLYVAVTGIRAAMMLVLWPLLNCLGERVTWKEALVMTWSGLRGAVGLVLAIVVDEEPSIAPQIGSHFMFHIGGIAMLTIMVNATLCAPLLRCLGLVQPPEIEEQTTAHFEQMTHEDARSALDEVRRQQEKEDGDPRWAGTNLETVKALLPSLDPAVAHAAGSHHGGAAHDEAAELRMYRQTFMRYVESQYWTDIEEGLIPRTSRVARVLLYSASGAIVGAGKALHDWKVVLSSSQSFQLCPCLNRCIDYIWPLNRLDWLQQFFPAEHMVEMWKVYLALCFIDAHKTACEEVPKYFAGSGVLSPEVQEQVASESRQEVEEAAHFLEGLSGAAVNLGKSRMLAGKLLHRQLEKVASLAKLGILDANGASHITHHLHDEHRQLAGSTRALARSGDGSAPWK